MRKRLFVLVLLLAAATPLLAVRYPRLNVRHRQLANGLAVYSVEDHATPVVAVQVWYRVGSRDDPLGRNAFTSPAACQRNAAGQPRSVGVV